MMSDRETYCKITSEDLKKKTTTRPEAIQIVLRSRFEFVLLCSSITDWTEESIFMPRIRITSRRTENLCKRVDRKAMHDSALSRTQMFAKHTEDTALKLKFHLCSKTKPLPGLELLNGVEKCVREAMPIQEEERASGKPAAKARPILKPSSTSNRNFIPTRQRNWIDIEVQRSKDHSCFQMPKFITQSLRHNEVGREEDAGVPFERNVKKFKEVPSEDSKYWSDEVKQKLNMVPALVSGDVERRSVKRWWTNRKGFNTVWNQSIQKNSSTCELFKDIQEKLILEMLVPILYCKTTYCYRKNIPSMFITSDTERNGDQECVTCLVPGGFSTKTGCILHRGGSDEWWTGLKGDFLRFVTSKNRALQEYLETTSRHSVLVQFIARSRKRSAIFF